MPSVGVFDVLLGFGRVGLPDSAVELGDDRRHLVLAQVGERGGNLFQDLPLGVLVELVILHDTEHRLDAADHAVGLGLNLPLLFLPVQQAGRLLGPDHRNQGH